MSQGMTKARARYFPYSKGVYQVAPLLKPFSNDDKVFEIDEDFEAFRKEKLRSLSLHPARHALESRLTGAQRDRAALFMAQRLVSEYPELVHCDGSGRVFHFSHTQDQIHLGPTGELMTYEGSTDFKTEDALVALALQVQEDFSLWTYDDTSDWMAYASICFPNHWAPEEKIGRDFFAVHEPVAESGPMLRSSKQLVQGMIHRGPFVRFAWGVATDTHLNHHPLEPQGRAFDPEKPALWVRVERQTLHGFPEEKLSFFTIRTYFEDVSTLKNDPELCQALRQALLSMTPASRVYKGLDRSLDSILDWLDARTP